MTIPVHYIHCYQRPAQGSSFLKRYPVYNYQHTINAMGWFDTASCDIAVHSESEGNDILLNYLGAFVSIFVDNPAVPIWEGLINRIIFNSGNSSYTQSLDEMANRVNVIFTGVTNNENQTAAVNSTGSQAVYGIKQDQIEFGVDPTGGAATQRSQLQNTIISQRAWPQTSWGQGQGQTNTIHFELIGIYHTLEWEKQFTALLTTNTAATNKINANLGLLANGATFFDNTDTTRVTTNAVTIPDQQRSLSTWELFQKIAETGDATNYWVIGILPTDPNLKTRRLYYRQFNSAVEYTARQADGLRIRNLYGKLISPWLVVPDRSIRVVDTLVGFGSSITTDPRVTYIQNIQYYANSQQVQCFGTEDTTARAAFLLKRKFKPISRDFGAPLRVIAT